MSLINEVRIPAGYFRAKASQIPYPIKNTVADYFQPKVAHPDPGSEFEKNVPKPVQILLRVPGSELLMRWKVMPEFERKGMDALLIYHKYGIVGHCAYEDKPDNSRHVFSIEMSSPHRHQKLGLISVVNSIYDAHVHGKTKMRVSKGSNEKVEPMLEWLQDLEGELGIRMHDGGWFDLIRKTEPQYLVLPQKEFASQTFK